MAGAIRCFTHWRRLRGSRLALGLVAFDHGCPLAHDVDAALEVIRPLVGQHCGASYRVGEHHLSDVVFDALLGGPGSERGA